jgi:Flp pilus assembly protein TadB
MEWLFLFVSVIIAASALLLVISFLAEMKFHLIQRWKLRYRRVSTENTDHRSDAIEMK